ncbi:hypothetical protein M378DRAFT_180096 [Amanita muscaria Koide BX008]|uniref:Uncharacterized protein n=1 Tax=Amanita muscaria (strain Koide BX008) TaxID=946122 RepID=A0A0C2WX01_AMAMK|nr:hypothetical protein M378DRAFT_180096 [Amanita muscaria Koide BX008]
MSPHNEYLVVHDSEGYEPGDPRKFEVIKKFITKRCNAKNFSEKLHAVWLCITIPFGNGRVLETGDEEICNLKQLGAKYGEESLPKLVQITLKNISIPKHPQQTKPFLKRLTEGISKKKVGIPDEDHTVSPAEDYSDPRTLMLVFAQRVDINSKLAASISIGKRKYWSGLASGFHFRNSTIWHCLKVIHTDIINVWNIRGLNQVYLELAIHTVRLTGYDKYLLSDGFRGKISIIVGELRPDVPGQRWKSTNLAELLTVAGDKVVSAGPAAVVMAPVAAAVALAAWVHEIYKQAPHIIRCFMGYIVDLTIIMQTLFKIPAQDRDGNIETTRVEEILDNFAASPIKDTVHDEIRVFVDGLRSRFEKDAIIEKIDSLIYSNKDVQL